MTETNIPAFDDMIGKLVLVRTTVSGVSIGKLHSVQAVGGTVTVQLTGGWRIWSWEGAFTCSEIATDGATCRVAEHPALFTTVDSGTEILPVSDHAWEVIQANWTVGAAS